MRNILIYLFYTFLVKAHIIIHPNSNVQKHILSKNTLQKLMRLILRYPYLTIYNALHSDKSIYSHSSKEPPFMKSLKYRLAHELPVKILITPSYCEKPVECPVRFTDYCDREHCNIQCKFKNYPELSTKG